MTTSYDVQVFCSPFLKHHHLSYFQYLKVHADGHMSLLSNRADWLEFIAHFWGQRPQMPAVYSHYSQKEHLNKQSYWFLWEPNLPATPVKLAQEFNMYHGLTLVERFKDSYTMCAFALSDPLTVSMDYYLNQLGVFKHFIDHFQLSQAALIQKVEQNKILLSANRTDHNLNKLLMGSSSNKFKLCFNHIYASLSAREIQCLNGLPLGMTYKEIAHHLKISPRTVESYLQRIKDRFRLKNRKELIQLNNHIKMSGITTGII